MHDFLEWLRFGLSALFMLTGLFLMATGVMAQYRFRYVLNRMHAASMGDSLGLLTALLSLCLGCSDGMLIAKYLLVTLFLWITSPTASHLIARMELTLNEHPEEHMELIDR